MFELSSGNRYENAFYHGESGLFSPVFSDLETSATIIAQSFPNSSPWGRAQTWQKCSSSSIGGGGWSTAGCPLCSSLAFPPCSPPLSFFSIPHPLTVSFPLPCSYEFSSSCLPLLPFLTSHNKTNQAKPLETLNKTHGGSTLFANHPLEPSTQMSTHCLLVYLDLS